MSVSIGTAVGYLDLDASKFKKGLEVAQNSLDKASREFRKSEADLKTLSTTMNSGVGYFKKLDLQAKSLGNQLKLSQNEANSYKIAIDKTSSAVKDAEKEHASLGNKLTTLQGHLARSNELYGEGSEQSKRYADAISKIKSQQSTLENDINQGNIAIEEFGIALQNAESDVTSLQGQLKNFKLNKIGSDLKDLGGTLTTKLTLPLVGIGTASVATATNFEKSMSQVAATMGMTVEEINNGSESYKKLEKAALDMGATTQFSASEASEALNIRAVIEKSIA